MASRLYHNTVRYYLNQYQQTELSTALPVGTLKQFGAGPWGLVPALGYASTGISPPSPETSDTGLAMLAQTADQDGYYGKWISPYLAVPTVEANTWTIAFANAESNANANFFAMFSIYVLKNDDTVRGFIYDAHTALGSEYSLTEDGQVYTVSGSRVAGCLPTDRIAIEHWTHAVQAAATSYNWSIWWRGATAVTDSTTTDAGCYIETPQNGVFSRSPNVIQSTTAPHAGAAPASAASSWGFGSWAHLMFAGWPYDVALTGFTFAPQIVPALDTTHEILFEIGTGPLASEVTQIQIPYSIRNDTQVGYYLKSPETVYFPDPVFVRADTRVSIRVADSNTGAQTYDGCKLMFKEVAASRRSSAVNFQDPGSL